MMTSERRAALITGTLLLAGIVAAVASSAVEHPILTGTFSVARVSQSAARLSAGGLLELLTAAASVGIAISLYPVLRKRSEGLATGAVALRAIESAMYAVAAVITLTLPGFVLHDAHAAAIGNNGIQAVGTALLGMRQYAVLAGVFAYIAGATMYYIVLYRSRLLPRWLPVWGVSAEVLMLIASVSAAFTHTPVTSYTYLYLPIAVQEATMGAWLILRGFSAPGSRAQFSSGAATSPQPVGTNDAV